MEGGVMANERTILYSTTREDRLAASLREVSVQHLAEISLEEAAAKLGIRPGGVEALMWKSSWPLETAFRVADCLDLVGDFVEKDRRIDALDSQLVAWKSAHCSAEVRIDELERESAEARTDASEERHCREGLQALLGEKLARIAELEKELVEWKSAYGVGIGVGAGLGPQTPGEVVEYLTAERGLSAQRIAELEKELDAEKVRHAQDNALWALTAEHRDDLEKQLADSVPARKVRELADDLDSYPYAGGFYRRAASMLRALLPAEKPAEPAPGVSPALRNILDDARMRATKGAPWPSRTTPLSEKPAEPTPSDDFWANVRKSAARTEGLPQWTGAGIALSENFEGGKPTPERKPSFDAVAKLATEAIDIAASGRMRPTPLVHEGARAYAAERPPAPERKPPFEWSPEDKAKLVPGATVMVHWEEGAERECVKAFDGRSGIRVNSTHGRVALCFCDPLTIEPPAAPATCGPESVDADGREVQS